MSEQLTRTVSERGGQTQATVPIPAPGGGELLLRAEALGKSFFDAGREVRVLRGLEMEVKAGEEIAVVGQSGVGSRNQPRGNRRCRLGIGITV